MDKFKIFLESLKDEENSKIIETIKNGYDICFENALIEDGSVGEVLNKIVKAASQIDKFVGQENLSNAFMTYKHFFLPLAEELGKTIQGE